LAHKTWYVAPEPRLQQNAELSADWISGVIVILLYFQKIAAWHEACFARVDQQLDKKSSCRM